MIDPNMLSGDLFRQFIETDVGSRGLVESMLSSLFGPTSQQARVLRPQYGNLFTNYLGQFMGQSPLVQPLLGGQQSSYGRTQQPRDFLDYMGGIDFNRMYQMMGPRERGVNPSLFSPVARRVS